MNSRENEDASDEEESDENVSGDNTNEKTDTHGYILSYLLPEQPYFSTKELFAIRKL